MENNHNEKARMLDPVVRKGLTLALQMISQVGQTEISSVLGISGSTVSRIKSERLEEVVKVLAACGLKIVPQNNRGDHAEFIDAVLVLAHYGVTALRRDQSLLEDE